MLCFCVESSLHPVSSFNLLANSLISHTYKFPHPQLLQNQQIRDPFVSVDFKHISTPFDSTLTDTGILTLLESTLKKTGEGVPPFPKRDRSSTGVRRRYTHYPLLILTALPVLSSNERSCSKLKTDD